MATVNTSSLTALTSGITPQYHTPLPSKTTAAALLASAACAASGAYTRTGILDVKGARHLTLLVSVTGAGAGAVGGVVSLIPLMSAESTEPAPGDDTWFGLGINDGSITGGTLTAASLPSGTDFSVTPDFGRSLNRGLDIRTEPLDANTDTIRMRVKLDVSDAQWVQVLYAEAGVVATPVTVAIKYALSV
jgi:hypothetical protein